jgi:hypothetical protein
MAPPIVKRMKILFSFILSKQFKNQNNGKLLYKPIKNPH